MARSRKTTNKTAKHNGIDLRKLKKELKLIPFDIKREMRFLDLLFSERNIVRTQAEREVLKDLIDRASSTVKFYQNRLLRFQECYVRTKERKPIDGNLLLPDERESLLKWPAQGAEQETVAEQPDLRTGTDG